MEKVTKENWKHFHFGISIQMIVKEALAQNIAIELVDKEAEILRLKKEGKIQYIEKAACTSADDYITVLLLDNKLLSNHILAENHLRVPRREILKNYLKAKNDIAYWSSDKVVMKPKSADQGQGISFLSVHDEDQCWRQAFSYARQYDDHVIIEEYIPGDEYRFLIIDFKVIAVVKRIPPIIIGDGMNSIKTLVDTKNLDPQRNVSSEVPLYPILLDSITLNTLKDQNFSIKDIPADGQKVYLRKNSNVSTGGEAIDVTGSIHPGYEEIAAKAARILGTRLTGLDMMIAEPDTRPDNNNHAVIELNKEPALFLHRNLSREVASAILNVIGF